MMACESRLSFLISLLLLGLDIIRLPSPGLPRWSLVSSGKTSGCLLISVGYVSSEKRPSEVFPRWLLSVFQPGGPLAEVLEQAGALIALRSVLLLFDLLGRRWGTHVRPKQEYSSDFF